ncbi:MAG: hypothetical protein ACFFDN_48650 [Candidatus Hodarchaeota archaeon]
MDKNIGIWLDHEKAAIVTIVNGLTTISHLHAEAENNNHSLHGASSATHFGHQEVTLERKIERRHKEHLHHYYQNIIHEIRDSKKIFIFGPGEAKIELEKEIKKTNDLASKIIAVESADKMTDHQIAEKVRNVFEI